MKTEEKKERDKLLLQEFSKHPIAENVKLKDVEIMGYGVIRNENNINEDSSFLEDCIKSKNFTSICINTLNNNSWTAYEIAVVKIKDFKVDNYFHSYFKMIRPLAKAMDKITPQEIKEEIESAPDFKEIWTEISNLLDTKVLIGPSINRLLYLCDKKDIDFPLVANIGAEGPYPRDWKSIYEEGGKETDDVLKIALEWAYNTIEYRIEK